MNELIPPHNAAAEQALLGTILVNNDVFEDIIAIVDTEDFYHAVNRDVFELLKANIRKGLPADLTTIGGHDSIEYTYVIELMRCAGAEKNAVVYAQTVKDKSLQRQLIGACYDITENAYQNTDNVISLISEAEQKISKVSDNIRKAERDNSATAALKDTYKEMRQAVESDGALIGISTGIPDLDKRTNGLKRGTMIILAARPGMGKTTLALNFLEHEALSNGFPIMFSIEMPRTQIMQKMISSVGNVPLSRVLSPKSLDDYQWAGVNEGMTKIKATNLEVHDDSSMTVDDIRFECRRYLKKHGKLTLIVVDYLQLIRGSKAENRTQEISQISRDLKAISREFDAPLLALSQLSRKCEERADKRPMASDLRESGSIEQDADEIYFIYRDDFYDENSPNEGLSEIIVNKIRMGVAGKVFAEFDGSHSRFTATNRVAQQKTKLKPFAERFSA